MRLLSLPRNLISFIGNVKDVASTWEHRKQIIGTLRRMDAGGNEGGLMKTCLNCKYEPKWADWIGVEYKRCVGKCRYPVKLPILPRTHRIAVESIIRYDDDSGVIENCLTWQEKSK